MGTCREGQCQHDLGSEHWGRQPPNPPERHAVSARANITWTVTRQLHKPPEQQEDAPANTAMLLGNCNGQQANQPELLSNNIARYRLHDAVV